MGGMNRSGGPGVTDLHIHIQPWGMLLPEVAARMRAGRRDLDRIQACTADPARLLEHLDSEGIEWAALVNYPSPDLMGFTAEVNQWVADYCRPHGDRLLAVGSVHPRFVKHVGDEARKLLDMGIRMLKVHPPHQLLHANDYRDGGPWPGLGEVYAVAQERGVPVMIHTGTSVFAGARNKYGNPLDADDVAVDFPDLTIILAHGGRPLWVEEAFFLVRRHPRVHLDVSGIPPSRLLDYFPRLASIADRVLWGTDWPAPGVPGLAENVEMFRALPLPEGAQHAILAGNAERIFPRD